MKFKIQYLESRIGLVSWRQGPEKITLLNRHELVNTQRSNENTIPNCTCLIPDGACAGFPFRGQGRARAGASKEK